MHQRQAEVAACDLRYGAGGRLEDAQAVAMPGCCIGFVNADRWRSPPFAGHKESASEETLHTKMGKLDIDAVVNLMLQPTYNVVCVSDAKSKEFFLLFGACQ